jgi:hypothetical protein
MAEIVRQAKALRQFYPSESKIGSLLDELTSDIEGGAPRAEVVEGADALLTEIDPGSTAYRMIGGLLRAFRQEQAGA